MDEKLMEALEAVTVARRLLNELMASDEEPAAEERAKREKALDDADRRLEDALREARKKQAADALTFDAEAREREELRARTPMADYLRAAIQGVPVSGAAAEFAAACKCPVGQMPLEAFGRPERRRQETREDMVSQGPAAGTQATTAPIGPNVFHGSLTEYLGIEMPVVASGQAVYPILTTSGTAGPVAQGEGNDATAAVITPFSVRPGRIQGRIKWQKEDAALLADLDTALVGDVQSVLRDALDHQTVNGDGVSPNLRGVGAQLPLDDPASATDAEATSFETLVRRSAVMVDGLYAMDFASCRMAMSVPAYTYLAALFRANETDLTALDWLMQRFGGIKASGRIAPVAGDSNNGPRSQVYVRRTSVMERAAVLPVWQGVSLIRDEITRSREGEVIVNADMLVGGVAYLRPDAFAAFPVATAGQG